MRAQGSCKKRDSGVPERVDEESEDNVGKTVGIEVLYYGVMGGMGSV